jgi:hypothetical protein
MEIYCRYLNPAVPPLKPAAVSPIQSATEQLICYFQTANKQDLDCTEEVGKTVLTELESQVREETQSRLEKRNISARQSAKAESSTNTCCQGLAVTGSHKLRHNWDTLLIGLVRGWWASGG